MARYTGPKSRIARKFGEGIFGADKVLSQKNYPPGQHGNSRKRKTKKNIPAGEVHIHSTFNNTIVTITDLEGNVVSWASAGTQGVKGSKKSTPFAAGMAAEAAGREATAAGMKTVNVKVKGLGSGREAAIRSLQTVGLEVKSITDETPIPHNGCRPPKRRRG